MTLSAQLLTLLLLLYLASPSTTTPSAPALAYSPFTNLSMNISLVSIGGYTTADSTRVICFGNNSFYAFDVYTWQSINSSPYQFDNYPLAFFMDQFQTSCALYQDSNYRLLLRKYRRSGGQDSYEDTYITKPEQIQFRIYLLDVSDDGSLWATIQSVDYQQTLVIGSTNGEGQPRKLALNSSQTLHFDNFVQWQNREVVLVGRKSGPDQTNMRVLIVDADTLALRRVDIPVVSTDYYWLQYYYNPSKLLLYISSQSLFILNTVSGQTIPTNITGQLSLYHRKDMLRVKQYQRNSSTSHHYYFPINASINDLLQNKYLFSYQSNGDDLSDPNLDISFVVQATGQYKYHVSKLCNSEGWFYNSQLHQCQPCHQSCLNCLFAANTCIQCSSPDCQLDLDTRICTCPGFPVVIIVLIVIGVAAVLAGAAFAGYKWYMRRKRDEFIDSLLEKKTERTEQDYHQYQQ